MSLDWSQSREEYRWIGALFALTFVAFSIASLAGYIGTVAAYRIVLAYAAIIWLIGPAAVLLALIPIGICAIVQKSGKAVSDSMPFIRARFGNPALAAASLAPILLMPLLMGSFGTLKMLMPLATDFTWDDWFAQADKLLFFGHQPWELTHTLFGSPFATRIIDSVYSMWVAFLFTAVIFYALIAPRYERARFFLAFAAGWMLIGVAGAYLFASAGPCYLQLTGAASAADFAPLMERLRSIDGGGAKLSALEWQQVLWQAHVSRDYGFAMGISAMPSMHNAITVLYALSLARASRMIRIAAWGLVAIIFIGSVHLGWHYALDGIVAGLMMWGVWAAAGAYLDRIGYSRAQADGEAASAPRKPVAI
jgi:hypothetical protein